MWRSTSAVSEDGDRAPRYEGEQDVLITVGVWGEWRRGRRGAGRAAADLLRHRPRTGTLDAVAGGGRRVLATQLAGDILHRRRGAGDSAPAPRRLGSGDRDRCRLHRRPACRPYGAAGRRLRAARRGARVSSRYPACLRAAGRSTGGTYRPRVAVSIQPAARLDSVRRGAAVGAGGRARRPATPLQLHHQLFLQHHL
eukprot:ctg_302.g120